VVAYPKIGSMRVDSITTEDVLRVVEPIWRTIPETASRVRGRIESVLSWAIANRYWVGLNSARWVDGLEHLLPARAQIAKVVHYKALPYAEVPGFLSALTDAKGIAALALRFLVLTAARSGEVLGATWSEIDLKTKTWTIPGERMKGGKEHRVPLSEQACEILEALPRDPGNDRVFFGATKGGLSSMSMLSVIGRLGYTGKTSAHGLRSSFKDWCSEQTNYPHELAEMALAHTVGNVVERAYRRGDQLEKRKRLMQDWAMFCYTSKPVAVGDNVVSIRA
jgi:integrase